MEKITKTPQQVASQMERWFFLYYKREKSTFKSDDVFTLFDLLSVEKQCEIISQINLPISEIPVLILLTERNDYILNTTTRFIKVSNSFCESIYYADFDYHKAYRSLQDGLRINIKRDGLFEEFGLMKKNGELIYWKIPTGRPGFGFWNITAKFEIIGRRYLITTSFD